MLNSYKPLVLVIAAPQSTGFICTNGTPTLYPALRSHSPGRYHLPPPNQPLRIQIEGPLIAIQRLLPYIQWHLKFLDRPFPQAAGPELARLTYQVIYGQDVRPEVPGDLAVRDEYLGWMPEKYPDQ